LGIAAGVGLGLAVPGAFQAIAGLEIAHVNLVVAVFIWVMIYPMVIQIDWSAVKDMGKKPRGLALTLVVNWLIKPFTMAALGVLFFQYVFAPFVDPQSASEYIVGMILLGVAPCTAMVFVWSQLVKGDANYTLVQVSINDLVMGTHGFILVGLMRPSDAPVSTDFTGDRVAIKSPHPSH
jgi:ACR3 family arsenite transporter